jgi:hypothetical protein
MEIPKFCGFCGILLAAQSPSAVNSVASSCAVTDSPKDNIQKNFFKRIQPKFTLDLQSSSSKKLHDIISPTEEVSPLIKESTENILASNSAEVKINRSAEDILEEFRLESSVSREAK